MTDLTQLGQKSEIPDSPERAIIEVIPFDAAPICVRLQVPEFTSLCPVTGQPDFARLVIDYIPKDRIIESKSLKLFCAFFMPRGGVPIDVFYSRGERPFTIELPEVGMNEFRGR